jgi:hypothetical protein
VVKCPTPCGAKACLRHEPSDGRCNIEAVLAGFPSCRATFADLTAEMHAWDSSFRVYTESDVQHACVELSARGHQLCLRGREWLSYTVSGDVVQQHQHGDALREAASAIFDLG